MGAIQGAVNSVLGTAATVAAGVKHFKEQEESNAASKVMAAAKASEGLADTKKELNDINDAIKKGKADIKTLKEGWLPQEDGTRVADLFRSDEEKAADLKARRTALRTLKDKRDAKQMMIAAYQKVLGGKK